MARKFPPDRPVSDFPGHPGKPLSTDEAREAAENLAGLFRLLDAWDRATPTGGMPGASPATTGDGQGKPGAGGEPGDPEVDASGG